MAEEEEKPTEEEQAGNEAGGEEDAVKKKAAAPASSGPNPKLILLVLGLNALVLMILAFVVWKSYMSSSSRVSLGDVAEAENKEHGGDHGGGGGDHGGGHGDEKKKGDKDAAADNFIYETFTVNLADSRGSHFAKVDVAIEVDDSFVKTEVERLKPKIRDFINVVLSSKTYEQIESIDGREFLREEIRNKINGYLTRGQIKNVFFTQFIVQ